MRHISYIAAFAIILTAPSVAGSTQTSLPGIGAMPGIGTFSYSGSSVVTAPPAIVVAGLTRADRS